MITGVYRNTQHGAYVEVRGVWGKPDVFDALWLDADGGVEQVRYTCAELEAVIQAGILVRAYDKNDWRTS